MEIKDCKLEDIKPNKKNPRFIEDAIKPVAESINNFGFLVPIVVNEDMTVLAGHTRLSAAKLLGLKTVPTIQVKGLSEEKQKAFMLADNKTGEFAAFDTKLLAEILSELDDVGFDLLETGFNEAEIASLMSNASEEELETLADVLEDEGPKAPKEGSNLKKLRLKFSPEEISVIDNAIQKARFKNPNLGESEALAWVCQRWTSSEH